jgi:hypothetical protein
VPTDPNPIKVALPFVSGPERADLLVFVESKGRIGKPAADNAAPVAREAKTYAAGTEQQGRRHDWRMPLAANSSGLPNSAASAPLSRLDANRPRH